MPWKTPSDLKYTRNDEWIRVENGAGTIGITDYAQDQLNDIVYVELPAVGDAYEKGGSFGVVESVKAASDIYLPVGGKVTAVNTKLEDKPELINTDPYGEGWIIKIQIASSTDADDLIDASGYAAYCENR